MTKRFFGVRPRVSGDARVPKVAFAGRNNFVPIVAVVLALLIAACDSTSPTAPTRTRTTVSAPIPSVQSVVISGPALMVAGQNQTFTATATLTNGSTETAGSDWRSSNPTVATVTPSGLVRAVGAGSVSISVFYQGTTGTLPVNVFPNVAGHYTGVLDWTASGTYVALLGGDLTVVQVGSQLTLTGFVSLSGQIIQIPAVTGNVNQTGFVTATAGGAASNVNDPTCGTISGVSTTLTFAGNTARYIEIATTQFCGTWTISGFLTR